MKIKIDEYGIIFTHLSSSDEETLDGYHFEFVCNNTDEAYECMICLKIIKNFVELLCGHAGCHYCIQQWEKNNL